MADETAGRLAGNIRAELARRRIPHYQLAKAIGMDEASLSLRMTGVRDFRVSEVERIARFFDLPVSVMLGDRSEP